MPDVRDEEQQAQAPAQVSEPWKDFQKAAEGPWTEFAKPAPTFPPGPQYQIADLQTIPTTFSQKDVPSALSPKVDAGVSGFQRFVEGEAKAAKNWVEHPFRSVQYLLDAATLPKGVYNPPPDSPERKNPFQIKVGPGMRPELRPYGQAVADVASQLIDPDMIAQVATGGELAKAVPELAEIPHVVGKLFVTRMGGQLPEEAARLGQVLGSDASPDEKKTAVTRAVLDAGLTYLGAKGAAGGGPKPPPAAETLPRTATAAKEAIAAQPETQPTSTEGETPERTNASSQQQTTEVHGDVQSQPVEGARSVPVAEGERGVQSQAGGGLPEEAGGPPTGPQPAPHDETGVLSDWRKIAALPGSEFESTTKANFPRGVTQWGYELALNIDPADFPAMTEEASRQGKEMLKRIMAGEAQPAGSLRPQLLKEAIRMRQAIDEAVTKKATTDEELAAISKEHGVGVTGLNATSAERASELKTYLQRFKEKQGIVYQTVNKNLGSTPPASPTAPEGQPAPTVTPPAGRKKGVKGGPPFPPHPSGQPDILDEIHQLGGVKSPKGMKGSAKGDYDGYKEAFSQGVARLLRRADTGETPDQLLQSLHRAGKFLRIETVSDLHDAVKEAVVEREGQKTVQGGLTPREAKELKLQQVQGEDFRASVIEGGDTTNPPKVAGDVIKKPGDTFTFQGKKFTVESYDPEYDEYVVQDGMRFGRQRLSGEEIIHPDPTTPKLRTGEKGTGELLQGEDQPFNLAGEQGTDADRLAAAKEKAAQESAEAKRIADQQQGGLDLGPAMGADILGANAPSPNTPTSIKNAVVDQERAARGLPSAIQPLRRAFGEVWDRAMAMIDRNPETQDNLIEELRKKPRALTDVEDALLLHRQVDLQNDYGKATRDLAQHFEDGNVGMAQEAKLRVASLSDQLLDLYNIGKQAGTETGRGLNARKMMAMEDFTLAKMELDKRAANGGRRLTEDESAELARMHARIAETQKRLDEHMATSQARIAELEVKAALDRVKLEAQAKMDPVIKRIVTRIGDALHNQRDLALARIKARGTRLMAGIDPAEAADYAIVGASHLFDGALDFAEWSQRMISDFTEAIKPHLDQLFVEANKRFDEQVDAAAGKKKAPAVKKAVRDPAERAAGLADQIASKVKDGKRNQITMLVQRLARTFVERGVSDRDELIDRVHGVLTRFIPDMTRREAMDAISGYGDFRQLTKDAISVQLRDLKGQMQQVAKLEDMQAGIPPSKTGLERRVPSTEESRLIKAVNDAKRQFQIPVDDPNTQLKSALDTLKTRLRNRTAELEEKIANGDFAPKQRRELRLDAEALRLKAENERAKEEFRRNVMKDRLRQRTGYEKVADAWVKIRRAFILSGPTTLAKLTSAAVQRMAFTPVEELAGAGYSSLFPAIAKRAAREGGISTRAEARALTEGFTKGMKDAWQVLKTGRSDLDVLYGRDKGYPMEWINLMGNIHGALKTVAKRNEFARSLQKRVESAMNGGVDVSDPMVQTKLALDAYKDANRSIFQQDNRVVSAYKRALSALDEPDKATGHVPVARKVAGMTARTLLPIVKIPTNIVAETFQYATGLVTGSARLAKAYHDGISNLKPEEADLIMRQLKKGSLGAAVLLLGYFSPNTVGGYYQQSEKRKKGDVKPGTVRVFGHDIPSFLLHNPLLEALQIGATVRRVADSKLKKRDKDTQGIAAGVWAGGLGLAEEVPFVRETSEISKAFNPRERGQFVGELGRSLLVPQAVQWIAQHTDKDAKGNLIARKPETAMQRIDVGIPGMREQVPKARPQPRQ